MISRMLIRPPIVYNDLEPSGMFETLNDFAPCGIFSHMCNKTQLQFGTCSPNYACSFRSSWRDSL